MPHVAVFVVALALAFPAFAHDFYLMPSAFSATPGQSLTVGLFNGDSFPESAVSPVLARVRDVRLLTPGAAADATHLRAAQKEIRADVRIPDPIPAPGGAILVARTVPHFLSLQPNQFADYLSHEGLDSVLDWREKHHESQAPSRELYSKYAKALIATGASNSFHTHETGAALEIVPEASPYDLQPNEPLILRVLHNGRPVSGEQVEVAWSGAGISRRIYIAGRTDSAGRLQILLEKPGKYRLHTVLMERCADQKAAAWESYWASLTFETR